MSNIGFIGLGHMGWPMALNLIHAGHRVTGFDINPEVRANFAKAKGQAAPTLSVAVCAQDIVITMLQTGQQVKEVYLGDTGLLTLASKSTLLIDCSSIDVQSSREIHHEASERGFIAVDAPVSGGVAGATQATLTIMIGGTQQAFDAATPVLSHLAKKIIHTGEAGSGQAAKICNNMILGVSMIAVSEAFALAEQLGLAPQKLFDVVTNSSGQCWAMSHYVPVPGLLENVPANQNYQPGFTAAMMLKDLNLSQQCAEAVGIQTPLGHHAMTLYQQFSDENMGQLDFSAIIKLIKQG